MWIIVNKYMVFMFICTAGRRDHRDCQQTRWIGDGANMGPIWGHMAAGVFYGRSLNMARSFIAVFQRCPEGRKGLDLHLAEIWAYMVSAKLKQHLLI